MKVQLNAGPATRTLAIAAALVALGAGPMAAQRPEGAPIGTVPRGQLKTPAVALTPPGGLRAVLTPNSVGLTWTCTPNAVGYEVYVSEIGVTPWLLTKPPIGPQCIQDLSLAKDPRLPAPTQVPYVARFTHSGLVTSSGLAAVVDYWYVVRALYAGGFADSQPLAVKFSFAARP